MKTRTFVVLVIVLWGCFCSHSIAQTRKPVARKTVSRKAKPEPKKEDPKVIFDMKLQGDGTFFIDSINNYYVANFTGKTAHQLYSDVLARLSTIYTYPDKVTNKVEDRSIIINAIVTKIDQNEMMSVKHEFNLAYRVELQFKDGKIRLNVPTLTRAWEYAPYIERRTECNLSTLSVKAMFYPRLKENANAYFNNLYTSLVYGTPQDEDW